MIGKIFVSLPLQVFWVPVNRRSWEEPHWWPKVLSLCLHISSSHGRRTQAWKEEVGTKSFSCFLRPLKEWGRSSQFFCIYGELGTARSFGCCFWSLVLEQAAESLRASLALLCKSAQGPWELLEPLTTHVLWACPGALLYLIEGSQSNGNSGSSCNKGLFSGLPPFFLAWACLALLRAQIPGKPTPDDGAGTKSPWSSGWGVRRALDVLAQSSL